MELEIRNIKKSYGRKRVLCNTGLVVKAGQCTGIIGANGCGKSTLLKILAGVEKADAGELLINGETVGNPSRQMAKYVGYIPQESALMPELTVEDNLRLWAGFGDHRENLRRLAALSEQFKLSEFYRERAKNLSGGMSKRVNIVCALIHRPELLLMDEPSAALDLVFKEELKGYIQDFVQKGGSVLISSHDEGEISACQSLWALRDGMAFPVGKELTMEEMVGKYMK